MRNKMKDLKNYDPYFAVKPHKYFDSGLRSTPFYKEFDKFELIQNKDHWFEEVEWDIEIFADYYGNDLDTTDEDEKKEALDEIFWDKLGIYTNYYHPRTFDERAAHECDLIPFKLNGLELLAARGGFGFSERLDAYQALTSCTIDENSNFFYNFTEFKDVLGEELTRKVIKMLELED